MILCGVDDYYYHYYHYYHDYYHYHYYYYHDFGSEAEFSNVPFFTNINVFPEFPDHPRFFQMSRFLYQRGCYNATNVRVTVIRTLVISATGPVAPEGSVMRALLGVWKV